LEELASKCLKSSEIFSLGKGLISQINIRFFFFRRLFSPFLGSKPLEQQSQVTAPTESKVICGMG
jgi:hypothetical protein